MNAGSETSVNRRKHTRYPLVLPVLVDGHAVPAWTENISSGGVFLRTLGDFGDEEFLATVQLPGLLEPFEVRGRRAWRRPRGTFLAAGLGITVSAGAEHLTSLAQRCVRESTKAKGAIDVVTVGIPHAPRVGALSLISVTGIEEAQDSLETGEARFALIAPGNEPWPSRLSAIKKLRSETKACLIGLSSDDADVDERALQAGLDYVLPPGFTSNDVLSTLNVLASDLP